MKSEAVLTATALARSYWQGTTEVQVLKSVDLEVAAGETVAIVGVSGSGKSTLLHLLAGLDTPDAGVVTMAGTNLSELDQKSIGELRNRHLGFVYQFHHLLPEFTALENVAMPLLIGGASRKDAYIRASELLDSVGLSHRVDHKPGALSGGERQRVAIARALVTTPSVVLADEPTGNLDEESAALIHELMLKLASEMEVAFVVVTHNRELAARMQRRLRLRGGSLEAET